MISKTGMRITDYFQMAGIKRDLSASTSTSSATAQTYSTGFRQTLASTGNNFHASPGKFVPAPSHAGTTGLDLTDYFNSPIAAKHQLSYSTALQTSQEESKSLNLPSIKANKNAVPAVKRTLESPAPSKRVSVQEKIEASIDKAAAKYDLPPGLIRGVIRAESNFQVQAVSKAGAQGLMQLMPATAKELGVSDAFDIDENVDGGARYLKQMLQQFDGDVKLALAAYNAGPGTVKKYGQIPPYRETQAYVSRVLTYVERPS